MQWPKTYFPQCSHELELCAIFLLHSDNKLALGRGCLLTVVYNFMMRRSKQIIYNVIVVVFFSVKWCFLELSCKLEPLLTSNDWCDHKNPDAEDEIPMFFSLYISIIILYSTSLYKNNIKFLSIIVQLAWTILYSEYYIWLSNKLLIS